MAPPATDSLDGALSLEMERWEAAGLRRRTEVEGSPGGVDFVSNDYLGLAHHPEVVAAARTALEEHGAGARAARLLAGATPVHAAAEAACAAWLGAPAALLFPTGYQANLGVVGALAGRGDVVYSDARNHASLIDAARLSRARVEVFAHADVDELDRRLGRAARAGTTGRRLVLTESVFSMDGDLAPLAELHAVCVRHDAWLIVDEAHAVGLLGPRGAGAWAAAAGTAGAGYERLAARVVTGGKALGVAGAFVVGSAALREHLVNRARAFVYTTAPSPAVAGALGRAIALAAAADEGRTACLQHARAVAEGLGLPTPAAAIVPVPAGSPERAVELAEGAWAKGLDLRAIRPPTVPEGTARLRVVCHATNRASEIDELVRTLREAGVAPAPQRPPAPALAPTTFVVGTDTGIGKTVVAAVLVRAARRRGPVRYWKPVQTGDDCDTTTVRDLSGAEPHELLRPAWALPLPASPHEAAADAGVEIDPQPIVQGLTSLRRLVPEAPHVVEFAGGLLVPYTDEGFTQADWLAQAGLPCVLVARAGLGTLNHTLLSLEALRARHVEPRALILVGEPHPSNRRTLAQLGHVPLVLELPWLESVDTASLDAWIDDHEDALAEILS